MKLEIEFTDELPPHMIVISAAGDDVYLRCSPGVEAHALAVLQPDVGMAVASAVEETE